MVELLAKSGDPDQTPHYAASDLGLHYLPNTLLGVSNGLGTYFYSTIVIKLDWIAV